MIYLMISRTILCIFFLPKSLIFIFLSHHNHHNQHIHTTIEVAKPPDPKNLECSKLGFNLPTNDSTKLGQLDNLSVDSYWVGETELDEIEKEKKSDPLNVNYKGVYLKLREQQQQQQQQNESSTSKTNENNNENSQLTLLVESSRNK